MPIFISTNKQWSQLHIQNSIAMFSLKTSYPGGIRTRVSEVDAMSTLPRRQGNYYFSQIRFSMVLKPKQQNITKSFHR
jgi:hypothetical protein